MRRRDLAANPEIRRRWKTKGNNILQLDSAEAEQNYNGSHSYRKRF